MIYRRLNSSESSMYREIRLESLTMFPEAFGATIEEERQEEKLGFEYNIEQETLNKFIIGAFSEEKLIGICGFSQDGNKKTKHRGSIIQMYVKPYYQGQKIGRKLLQKTMQVALDIPELEQIILGVVTTNVSAIKIYESEGFKEYGIINKYFKDNDQYFDQRLMIYCKS